MDPQLGLERTPEEYIARMVEVFREVRRVLRGDGTCWVIIGDSYARDFAKGGSGPNGKHDYMPDYGNARRILSESKGSSDGAVGRGDRAPIRNGAGNLKPKDLCGIPWMLAFALRADGWWLRQDLIWAKPNPMPESVTDRCTKAHEYIFLLTKSASYYFDSLAIAERLDAEAINTYSSSDGQQLFQEVEGGTPRVGDGITEKVSGGPEWSNEARCLPPNGNNESDSGKMAEVPCGSGVREEVPQECKKEGGPAEVLRERQGKAGDSEIPGDTKRKRVSIAGSPQAAGSNELDNLRSDRSAMGTNKAITAAPLRDVRAAQTADSGSHNTTLQGRAAHSQQHPGALPKLQQPKERILNIKGNMSERGVTRTTEGLNLKTADEKRSPNCTRNKRSVWTIATESFSGAHFATYPTDLIKPCILAGTSARGCCPKCGAPWERVVEHGELVGRSENDGRGYVLDKAKLGGSAKQERVANGWTPNHHRETTTTGWQPTCDCGDFVNDGEIVGKSSFKPIPCTVLDPFFGSGTTGQVSLELGRSCIGIELNPAYVRLAERRCHVTPGLALA